MKTIEELKAVLAENPGADEFVELASRLGESEETRAEAREVCFRGLAHNPRSLRGRLLLAKLFYLDRLPEFCIRELLELQKYTSTPALTRLLEVFDDVVKACQAVPQQSALAAQAAAEEEETVIGELDLESDFTEALEELDDSGDLDD